MFDKVYVEKRTDYVPVTKNINIGRAPTDESIKLWDEMKEKAYKSLLDTIKIDDNPLKLTAILYDEPYDYRRMVKYRFFLNGQEFTGSFPVDGEYQEMIKDIYKKAANQIAEKLTIHVIENQRKGTVK